MTVTQRRIAKYGQCEAVHATGVQCYWWQGHTGGHAYSGICAICDRVIKKRGDHDPQCPGMPAASRPHLLEPDDEDEAAESAAALHDAIKLRRDREAGRIVWDNKYGNLPIIGAGGRGDP